LLDSEKMTGSQNLREKVQDDLNLLRDIEQFSPRHVEMRTEIVAKTVSGLLHLCLPKEYTVIYTVMKMMIHVP